jgi:hypothetical protein
MLVVIEKHASFDTLLSEQPRRTSPHEKSYADESELAHAGMSPDFE